MQYQLKEINEFFYITTVYAKSSALERLKIWEDLENMYEQIHVYCLVEGDFNVILDESEKLGHLSVTQQEIRGFCRMCVYICIT